MSNKFPRCYSSTKCGIFFYNAFVAGMIIYNAKPKIHYPGILKFFALDWGEKVMCLYFSANAMKNLILVVFFRCSAWVRNQNTANIPPEEAKSQEERENRANLANLDYYFSSFEFYGFYVALIEKMIYPNYESLKEASQWVEIMKVFLVPIFAWDKIMDGWQNAKEGT